MPKKSQINKYSDQFLNYECEAHLKQLLTPSHQNFFVAYQTTTKIIDSPLKLASGQLSQSSKIADYATFVLTM